MNDDYIIDYLEKNYSDVDSIYLQHQLSCKNSSTQKKSNSF